MTLHVNNFLSWIEPREVYVNDAGTWRRVLEIWVNNAGTWVRVHASVLIATLTSDDFGLISSGYGLGYGSLSPDTLPDGRQVRFFQYDHADSILQVGVGGHSVDPGQGYLSYVRIPNGTQFTGASASSYLYNGSTDIAQWNWGPISQPSLGGTVEVSVLP